MGFWWEGYGTPPSRGFYLLMVLLFPLAPCFVACFLWPRWLYSVVIVLCPRSVVGVFACGRVGLRLVDLGY